MSPMWFEVYPTQCPKNHESSKATWRSSLILANIFCMHSIASLLCETIITKVPCHFQNLVCLFGAVNITEDIKNFVQMFIWNPNGRKFLYPGILFLKLGERYLQVINLKMTSKSSCYCHVLWDTLWLNKYGFLTTTKPDLLLIFIFRKLNWLFPCNCTNVKS